MSQLNFVVSAQMFTKSFASNLGRDAGDNTIYHLLTPWSIPDIFVIEVQSCPKQRALLVLGRSK